MRPGRRRATRNALALALGAIVLLAAAMAAVAFLLPPRLTQGGPTLGALVIGGCLVAAIGFGWIAFGLLDGHFDDIERLRRAIVMVDRAAPRLPPRLADGSGLSTETALLAQAIESFMADEHAVRQASEQRLAQVFDAFDRGILVTTGTGLVSLANGAARTLCGPEEVAVGTSVFAALERDRFAAAAAEARRLGRLLATTLAFNDGTEVAVRMAPFGEDGVVLMFVADVLDRPHALEHDLAIHAKPRPTLAATAEAPLGRLRLIVLDTETTGLDVGRDAVVSIGAVAIVAGRLDLGWTYDRLVDPERPIPAGASAIHGITDGIVAGAPTIGTALDDVLPHLDGAVLAGHSIGFDAAILERQAGESGRSWPRPPLLDTGLLWAALHPRETDVELETIAGQLGIETQGRHTALGDALTTAEILVRLLSLLADHEVRTLGEARAFSRRARGLLARQGAAGWTPP